MDHRCNFVHVNDEYKEIKGDWVDPAAHKKLVDVTFDFVVAKKRINELEDALGKAVEKLKAKNVGTKRFETILNKNKEEAPIESTDQEASGDSEDTDESTS